MQHPPARWPRRLLAAASTKLETGQAADGGRHPCKGRVNRRLKREATAGCRERGHGHALPRGQLTASSAGSVCRQLSSQREPVGVDAWASSCFVARRTCRNLPFATARSSRSWPGQLRVPDSRLSSNQTKSSQRCTSCSRDDAADCTRQHRPSAPTTQPTNRLGSVGGDRPPLTAGAALARPECQRGGEIIDV